MSLNLLFSSADIDLRLDTLAKDLNERYSNQSEVIIIGILIGSFMFLSDLVKRLNFNCKVEWIKASSYSGTESTGVVERFALFDLDSLTNNEVLIIEDILESGLTLSSIVKDLKEYEPKNISICCLFSKPDQLKTGIKADWVGFELKDEFVVGYGLDYNGQFRNLPEVYIYTPTTT